jgi:hypothetical protein
MGVLSGLLVWHAVTWHANGVHASMYDDIVAGGALLPVFYNLGLIVALALSLGLAMQGLTNVIGYRVTKIDHFEE